MTPDELRKQATALETLGMYAGADCLRQAADEIDRLNAVIEVRSASWLNTADALSECENQFRIATENLAEVDVERVAALEEIDRFTTENAALKNLARARGMLLLHKDAPNRLPPLEAMELIEAAIAVLGAEACNT